MALACHLKEHTWIVDTQTSRAKQERRFSGHKQPNNDEWMALNVLHLHSHKRDRIQTHTRTQTHIRECVTRKRLKQLLAPQCCFAETIAMRYSPCIRLFVYTVIVTFLLYVNDSSNSTEIVAVSAIWSDNCYFVNVCIWIIGGHWIDQKICFEYPPNEPNRQQQPKRGLNWVHRLTMIKAILVFNNHGRPRLSKFYQYFVSTSSYDDSCHCSCVWVNNSQSLEKCIIFICFSVCVLFNLCGTILVDFVWMPWIRHIERRYPTADNQRDIPAGIEARR